MFENIIGQEAAVETLRRALREGSLSRALLFSGPPASGKGSAALELARVSGCGQGGQWNCPCSDCEAHRLLVHSDLLLLGPDLFSEELTAALAAGQRQDGKRERIALHRALRKLTKRFEPALWEGEESKLSKALPGLRSIEEILSEIASLSPGSPSSDLGRRAVDEALKLVPLVPQGIPIFQVRNASAWARLSPIGRGKHIIIKNADVMQDASRNALLKILEEPPARLTIVLLSSRRSAILATILSRVRLVPFRQRTAHSEAEVLSRVFGLGENAAPSVLSYLESLSPLSEEAALEAARHIMRDALGQVKPSSPSQAALLDSLSAQLGPDPMGAKLSEACLDRGQFPRLARALMAECAALLERDPDDGQRLSLVEAWARGVELAAHRVGTLNIQADAAIRGLTQSMREAL